MRNLVEVGKKESLTYNRFIRGKVLNLKMGGRSIQLFRWYVALHTIYLVDLTKGQINHKNVLQCSTLHYPALPSYVNVRY